MAEAESNNHSTTTLIPPNQPDPTRFYCQFLYKAVTVAIFLAILPLFPSQAPEFVTQTVLTRGWELLHLLFVGIAVSYGLFSSRNGESPLPPEKEAAAAQSSYVPGLLQVSTVFDDETESGGGLYHDNSKVRTWSNQIQYHREEPVVVVSKQVEQQNGMNMNNPQICNNVGGAAVVDDNDDGSLLLPVRDLKTRVYDSGDVIEPMNTTGRSTSNLSSSTFGSSRFPNNYFRAGHDEESRDPDLGEDFEEDKVVLPSPIPWRSRSGRMEMKGELERPPFHYPPPSLEEAGIGHAFNPNFRNSLPQRVEAASRKKMHHHRTSSPPPHLLSRSLLSTGLEANAMDDVPRKKVPYMTSSPPPAPPPPSSIRKSPPMDERASRLNGDGNGSSNFHKDYRRSYTCETNHLSRASRKEVLLRRANSEREAKPRTQMDSSAMVRSVRTVKTGPDMEEMIVDQRYKEMEPTVMDKTGRKMMGPNYALIPPQKQKQNHISLIKMSSRTFSDYPKEGITEFPEKNTVEESGEKSGNDGDDHYGSAIRNEVVVSGIAGDAGPDVDKKADEFIAKFREQIRLQRIESIKRSSGHLGRNPLKGKHEGFQGLQNN